MSTIEMLEDKICGVCGGRALGYNFNALSCESCKAFFRRNAAKNKPLKCLFQNDCQIDTVTRKFCAKCRLDKCFAIGMNKYWILSEEEKQVRKVKIDRNKMKRKNTKDKKIPEYVPNSVNPSSVIAYTSSTNPMRCMQNFNPKPQARVSAMPQQPTSMTSTGPCHVTASGTFSQTFENTLVSVKNDDMYTDISCQNSSYFQAMPGVSCFTDGDDLGQVSDISSQYNCSTICNYEEIKSCEKKCEDDDGNGPNNIISNTLPHSTTNEVSEIGFSDECSYLTNIKAKYFDSNVMTKTEVQKINELISSILYVSYTELSIDQLICTKTIDSSICCKIADNGLKNLINFFKNIHFFKNACEEDQIALLKGSCMELSILWSVITYDSVVNGWEDVNGICVKMDELLKNASIKDSCEEFKLIAQSFDSDWKNDLILKLILTMIVLLTPKRPYILHPEAIEKELYSYYSLLQKYLESKGSISDASIQFIKIIQALQDQKNFSKHHLKSLVKNKPKHIEPLFAEILDL